MPDKEQIKLADILVAEGLISRSQRDDFLKEQEETGRFITEILTSHGISNEDEVTRILSMRSGLAYVDLASTIIEPKAIELVPEELCARLNAVPLYIVHDTLTAAMANPLDSKSIDEIVSVSGLKVKPVFACLSAIRRAVEKNYRMRLEEYQKPPQGEIPRRDRIEKDKNGKVATDRMSYLKQVASLAPVIEKVDELISKAVKMNASDIHLEPQRTYLNCRYRIDGILHSTSRISLEEQAAVVSRIKIMADMDIAEKRLPQDGRLRMSIAQREVDLRISTFPTIYGENLVIRILDRSSGILKLEKIGFSKNELDLFSELIRRPHGIVLVTGPTGSGKTTTLYAALGEINTAEKNIITLEDPVEYEIPDVRQSQVNIKAGLTFAAGLRSMVRQDPDIIMIGEIRDKETADIAIHAALTGHLVFSTLHTNDAPSAFTRLVDMGVEPFLVSSSVIGVLAQRLVRLLCSSCKEATAPSKKVLARLQLNKLDKPFYKETSCEKCKQRGYSGRSGIFELLVPDDKIKELIAQRASATVLRNEAIKKGMRTLRDAGVEKVISGATSVAELLRVTEEV